LCRTRDHFFPRVHHDLIILCPALSTCINYHLRLQASCVYSPDFLSERCRDLFPSSVNLHDGIFYDNIFVDPATHRRLTGIVGRECVAWRREGYEAPQPIYMNEPMPRKQKSQGRKDDVILLDQIRICFWRISLTSVLITTSSTP
jgi:hypothetical protein